MLRPAVLLLILAVAVPSVAQTIVPAAKKKKPSTTTSITLPTTTSITLSLPSTSTTLTASTTTTLDACALCDDGNPCTVDSCSSSFVGCVHHPLDDVPCPDEGIFCTRDRCQNGVCEHEPADRRCDHGDCARRACRPGGKGPDRYGCVKLEGSGKREGTACTSDDFSCTDDVCRGGACVHKPVNSRCMAGGVCQDAACKPASPGHDGAGCVVGVAGEEGSDCVEDGDVCTRDVCRGGSCAHVEDATAQECSPCQDAFEQTSALENLAGDLGGAAAELGGDELSAAREMLAAVQAELEMAAAVLAGRISSGAVAANDAAESPRMPASMRAHIAFTMILRTPQQVTQFLNTLALAQSRAALARPAARYLRARGRMLLHRTRKLRAQLRRMRHRESAPAAVASRPS